MGPTVPGIESRMDDIDAVAGRKSKKFLFIWLFWLRFNSFTVCGNTSRKNTRVSVFGGSKIPEF